ncbi:MAG: M48 family metalloprotease, partial [Candidatus Aminicenantales bacterium]
MNARLRAVTGFAAVAAMALLSGCSAVQKGADILASQGKISEKDRAAIVGTSQALRSTFADITDEEEYYIGRAVSALILSRYKTVDDDAFTRYLNLVGMAVVYNSDRPETYGGYHFTVLDSDEVNAMAAPGGFVFVTKGLVRRCGDEETLAAILAHEVGHVAARHGLQSIKKSRLVDAFGVIGSTAASQLNSEELTKLTGLFEGALGDVLETLVGRGYDRKYEFEADELSVKFIAQTGYNPAGLAAFLTTMERDKPSGPVAGWFKTHPSPADRLTRVRAEIAALAPVPAKLDIRTARFAAE